MTEEHAILSKKDQKLAEELNNLWVGGKPINELFDYALEHNAPPDLIKEIIRLYYNQDGVGIAEPKKLGLPWVKKMLVKGIDPKVIIDWIFETCFRTDHSLDHQMAFLVDHTAWVVFSGHQIRLGDLLVRMAEEHVADYVAEQLHIIRQTLGDESWHKIGQVVVNNLFSVVSDTGLANIANLPNKLRVRAALGLLPNFRTLPFIVRTLKSGAHNSTSDTYYDYRRKLLDGNRFPLTIPTTLRWAMLGGEPYNDPGGHFYWEDDFSGHPIFRGETTWWQDLRLAAQQNGWRFVKLVSREVDGQSELVAEINNDSGEKILYVHNNNGPRGDRLEEGDEVMVLADPTRPTPVGQIHDKSRIKYTKIDGKIVVRYELHPVKRPTEEMMRDPDTYFFGRDIPLERRKK